MNEPDKLGKSALSGFLRPKHDPKLNSHGQEPMEMVAGRESSHGKHPEFSLNVVRENGDETGTLYGLMVSAPYFNPSKGIQFVFSGWHIQSWDNPIDGDFLVTITGHNLHDISNHLKASTLERLVLGENVESFEVKKIGGEKPPGKKSGG